MRRPRLVLVAAGTLIVAGVGIFLAIHLYRSTRPHSISGSSTIDFVTTSGPAKRPPKAIETKPWPTYGSDDQRTHYASLDGLRPPFRRVWTYRAHDLLEFPPTIGYGLLFVPMEHGTIAAVSAKTGQVEWKKRYPACIASSPAVGDGVIYETMMNACTQPHDGRKGAVVALDARTGKQRWIRRVSASESSPLLVGNTVYFGARNGQVYALNARTGATRWVYTTHGPVKGAPAFGAGTIYVGSYDGFLYALYARTGKLRWRAGAESALLRGRGGFYATPTLAYGRVFVGNTDGAVYSFGATEGKLAWVRTTGRYVYASAAVYDKGVFVGSYDKKLYALDAATGRVRWTFKANGPISGSPTVMAGLVYFSTLAGRTYAVSTSSGKQVWTFADGQYSPLVADATQAYLIGHGRIYALAARR